MLPETSGFAFWDAQGNSLCSSKGANIGEYNVRDRLWYQTASTQRKIATGGYELAPPDGQPSLGFGIPITDKVGGTTIVGYLSVGLKLDKTDSLLAGTNLPNTGRMSVIDQNRIVISSSDAALNGQPAPVPSNNSFLGTLHTFLDSRIASGSGRVGALVRVTDADDAAVTVVVSADKNALVAPVGESLLRDLLPVLVLTLLALLGVWLLGSQWVVRPVTALVRASDALASGQLSTRVKVPSGVTEFDKLGESFNEMATRRERDSRAKDEFLGLVSHELRTPITTVLGNAEILSLRGDDIDGEARQIAVADIRDGAHRLVSVVDNLMALAQVQHGLSHESEPLPLMRLTQASVADQLRRAPARAVVVHGDKDLLALGEPTLFDQVLQNLVRNAIKYSPSDQTIDVYVEREESNAIVRVCDRGQGIDDNECEAIFQPYYRSARTSSFAEGVGIGLSVCRQLVEAMGGAIWCKPRTGGGCEFGFRLPLVEDEVAHDAGEEVLVPVADGGLAEPIASASSG